MHRKILMPFFFHQRVRCFLCVTMFTVIVLVSFCTQILSPSPVYAVAVPGGNIADPTVRAVDLNRPAVVRIVTSIEAHLTVHFSPSQSETFPEDGTAYTLQTTGTGVFVTSHGDLLTADHVVKPPASQLDDMLYQLAATDVAKYINENLDPDSPYMKDDAYSALKDHAFLGESNYEQPVSEAYLSMDYLGAVKAKDLQTMPAGTHAPIDQIKLDSPPSRRDVAIAHVNLNDTPSAVLGDSSGVSPQDPLTIIGFPNNGDVSDMQRPNQYLTSSVNQIYVSSIKRTDDGAKVIQVAGNVEHGNSGGPALNKQGQIIGIVSFDLALSTPVGTSFLQASESGLAMIKALHLDTQPGQFQKSWQTAFSDYTATFPGHWHQAADEFESIAGRYPNCLAAKLYLAYAHLQAQHETVPTPQAESDSGSTPSTDFPWIWVLGGGAALLLLIIIAIILLLLLGGRGRRSSIPPVPDSAPVSVEALPPAPPVLIPSSLASSQPLAIEQRRRHYPLIESPHTSDEGDGKRGAAEGNAAAFTASTPLPKIVDASSAPPQEHEDPRSP